MDPQNPDIEYWPVKYGAISLAGRQPFTWWPCHVTWPSQLGCHIYSQSAVFLFTEALTIKGTGSGQADLLSRWKQLVVISQSTQRHCKLRFRMIPELFAPSGVFKGLLRKQCNGNWLHVRLKYSAFLQSSDRYIGKDSKETEQGFRLLVVNCMVWVMLTVHRALWRFSKFSWDGTVSINQGNVLSNKIFCIFSLLWSEKS